ncbi:MAG: hypothetical protein E7399_03465 [Ruminococcaceae bacterium]|nr:hypothetical protein [Oscillospiraceae bacterium]
MSILKTCPAVFAVEQEYQIMVPTKQDALVWITVGKKAYYNHSNGVLRSHTVIHRMTVPMSELNREKSYSVHYRTIIERKPYFPESEEEVVITYPFRPLTKTIGINLSFLSDTHGFEDGPVKVGQWFGEELDVLVLGGDMPEHSGDLKYFDTIYRICEQVTKGEIPIVFARGNHDTRGFYAEQFEEYTPLKNGLPYYTFRLGPIWGLVLDTGEDKVDSSEEYNHTICFQPYREQQTEFIRQVAEAKEYQDATYRLVVAHIPFHQRHENEKFCIDDQLFCEWAKLIETIRPHLMLSGHLHLLRINRKGGEFDHRGQCCDVVVGAELIRGGAFSASALVLEKEGALVHFINDQGTLLRTEKIEY